ncbi:methyl-accepting chemotaxis protein [Anaerosporobacter faecicola]|uniref:methyl-accepting chemotaxis protein n=1 Tax=Anaerosporobacter faecicola TaxID=2718714 RepID=UPI00143AEACE|nr:methyl-accepting chemotaxis protein [Anaerosporobacter faecicola]
MKRSGRIQSERNNHTAAGKQKKKLLTFTKDKSREKEKFTKEEHKEENKAEIKRKGFGVRVKMTAVFLLLIIMMIWMGILNYSRAKNALFKTYVDNKEQTFTAMGNYMELIFENVGMQAVRIMTNESVMKFYNPMYQSDKKVRLETKKDIDSTIISIVNTDKYINSILLIVKDDTVFASNPVQISNTFYDDFAASEEGKLIFSTQNTNCWIGTHPFVDSTLNTIPSSYGLSMGRNLNGFVTGKEGAILIDINLSVIVDLLNNLADKNESMLFVTEDGREIFSDGSQESIVDSDFYKNSIASEKTSGTKYVTMKGETYLYTYCKISGTNNMLCSLVKQSIIYQSADSIKRTTTLMIACTSILALIIASLYASNLGKAIKMAVKGIAKVAEGDLTYSIKTKRKDEFGTLTNNLDHMRHNMKRLITNTAVISSEVKDSTIEVAQSSEVIKDSMSAISSAVDEIEQGMVEQADAANDCLNQMNLLANRIGEVTDSTETMVTLEKNTKAILEDNYDSLHNLYGKAKSTADITAKIVQDMDQLSKQSNAIAKIIDTIEDIATQSNLLSLNASIEAARAGVHGVGFAVVAQEIGKLAGQSLEAAQDVKNIAEGITKRTKETSNNVMIAKDAVSEQTIALDRTMEGYKGISKQTQELMEQIEKIKGEVYAIEIVKNDTLSAISNISAVSQQTAAATREVCDKTEYELESVEKLNQIITKLEQKAKSLEEEIGVFKIE